jgi:PPM family protein phosphatase
LTRIRPRRYTDPRFLYPTGSSQTSLDISLCSDVGRVRTQNEDSLLAVPPWRDLAISTGASLFVVADGMGGHAAGEVASAMAVRAAAAWLARQNLTELVPSLIEQMCQEANQAVWDYVQKHREFSGMGTTFSAALVLGKQALIGHVGDSRAYLVRDKMIRQLTNDHTLVAEQVRLGHLTPEAAKSHPARHILSRAMGVREFITIDTILLDLVPGDVLFLCSDGVSGMVDDEALRSMLLAPQFRKTVPTIVAAANQAGGADNSTGIALRFPELPVVIPGRYSMARLTQWAFHLGLGGSGA